MIIAQCHGFDSPIVTRLPDFAFDFLLLAVVVNVQKLGPCWLDVSMRFGFTCSEAIPSARSGRSLVRSFRRLTFVAPN